jgi:hypothetical protein
MRECVSAGRLEFPANGLKGQRAENASPIQWPAVFRYIHWTIRFKSTLDAFTKVESTLKRPMDLLPIDLYSG